MKAEKKRPWWYLTPIEHLIFLCVGTAIMMGGMTYKFQKDMRRLGFSEAEIAMLTEDILRFDGEGSRRHMDQFAAEGRVRHLEQQREGLRRMMERDRTARQQELRRLTP